MDRKSFFMAGIATFYFLGFYPLNSYSFTNDSVRPPPPKQVKIFKPNKNTQLTVAVPPNDADRPDDVVWKCPDGYVLTDTTSRILQPNRRLIYSREYNLDFSNRCIVNIPLLGVKLGCGPNLGKFYVLTDDSGGGAQGWSDVVVGAPTYIYTCTKLEWINN
jgi:hypothetical protein